MKNIEYDQCEGVVKQKYLSKKDAIIYFGFEHHKSVFQRLLVEFKTHKDFKVGYLLPTQGVLLIKIDEFEEFLRWRESDRMVS